MRLSAAWTSVIAAGALLLGAQSPATAAEASVRVVVKADSAVGKAAASGTGGQLVERVARDTVVLQMPSDDPGRTVATLRARRGVAWAEVDQRYKAARVPNDPCYNATCAAGPEQWALKKINAPAAWDVVNAARSVKVAVLDSGVDVNHPELARRVTIGPNYSDEPVNADGYGHGTHVAGIIGAAGNDGVGITGALWDADIVSVKVLANDGGGWASDVAAGVRWAADTGVRVANLSLGGLYSQVVADAVAYAQGKGVLVVAAADNGGSSTPSYPAALEDVMAVGASTQTDGRASFSNYGPWVDVFAPGIGILSTWPTAQKPANPYEIDQGTSMAAPLVAAAAAMLWSARPHLSASGVQARLRQTAAQVAGSGTLVASGRLDLGAALNGLPYGYRLGASDGGIFAFDAPFHGSTGGQPLNRPIVATMSSGSPDGYWLVASDGGVFSFGDAEFHGSTGAIALNRPIVGAAATRSGNGYWLVASDGGVFSFGDAGFYGSTGAMRLNSPIVAIVPSASGNGYWLVAADGGVFSFGDARFHGSTGALRLNRPVVTAARSRIGNGYWLVASDGGVFSFGDARFHGSTGNIGLNRPIVAMSPTPAGDGYWLVASDGGVFSFGDARFLGSTGNRSLNAPIVGISAT